MTLDRGSLRNQRPSPQSECGNGLISVTPNDRWYKLYTVIRDRKLESTPGMGVLFL